MIHLRECMNSIDPDVWYRPATKKDGTKYMEFILLYVTTSCASLRMLRMLMSYGRRFLPSGNSKKVLLRSQQFIMQEVLDNDVECGHLVLLINMCRKPSRVSTKS